MAQSSDRLYYVITIKGDVGPVSVDDLREQTRSGLLQRDDKIRTAFGRQLGTVGDLLHGAVGDRGQQRSTSPRKPPPGGRRMAFVLLATAVIAMGGIMLLWPSKAPLPTAQPEYPVAVEQRPPPPTPTPPKPASALRTESMAQPASDLPVARKATRELLSGVDFTKPSSDVLAGWIFKATERKGFGCRSEDGVGMLRLQATKGDALLHQDLTLPPGTRALQLSYRVRVTDVQPGELSWHVPRIVLLWKGDTDHTHQTKVHFSKEAGWQTQQMRIPVPEGYSTCALWVGPLQCTGTMYVSRLSLCVQEDVPAPAATGRR